MNAFALHGPADRAGLRWTLSALAIVALHAGLIAGAMSWYREQPIAGAAEPAIMIDMAPATAAPQAQHDEVAPGPEMQQADEQSAPPPEPAPPPQAEEKIEPVPEVAKPEVEAPPEQKVEPTPTPPEPAKVTPEPPQPVLEKPKPVRAEVKKKPSVAPPAPRTTAPPRSQQRASAAAAMPSAGASRAASANYNQLVAAQLQRYKQYPSASRAANEQGRAYIAFTLDRSGRLLSARLTKSSGFAALDAETLAVVRRAQPFPPFPAEKTGSTDSFNVPISFFMR
jgi:protein TonB